MKEKSAAILTIKDAPNMSSRGRKSIVDWIRRQATLLEKNSKNISARFTARYLYRILLVLLLPICLLTGCARFILPTAKQLDSLAKDPNSIRLKVATIYGTMDLERNMDRFAGPATNAESLIVTPTTTLKAEKVKR